MSARPRRCSATSWCGVRRHQRRARVARVPPSPALPRRATPAASGRRASKPCLGRVTISSGRSLAQGVAVESLAHAHAPRDPFHEAHQLAVEERHAQLEAGGHRHLVVAEQDGVREDEASVAVERPLEEVAPTSPSTSRARASRSCSASSPRRPVRAVRWAWSVISTSRTIRSASSMRPRRRGAGRSRRADRLRRRGCRAGQEAGHVLEMPQQGGCPAAVAAVGLVGALAGEHHLHVPREAREPEQRGALGIPHGSSRRVCSAPARSGNPSAPSPCRRCSVPITRASSAAASRSSRTLPWPGKPIVNVVGGRFTRFGHRRDHARRARPRR